MDTKPKLIDMGEIREELESFVNQIAANPSVDDSAVLRQAQTLLSQLNVRPVSDYQDNQSYDADCGAIRLENEQGQQNVICWREGGATEAVIEGTWGWASPQDWKLLFLTVRVGERLWGVRDTERGQSRIASGPHADGRGDRKLFADIHRRISDRVKG